MRNPVGEYTAIAPVLPEVTTGAGTCTATAVITAPVPQTAAARFPLSPSQLASPPPSGALHSAAADLPPPQLPPPLPPPMCYQRASDEEIGAARHAAILRLACRNERPPAQLLPPPALPPALQSARDASRASIMQRLRQAALPTAAPPPHLVPAAVSTPTPTPAPVAPMSPRSMYTAAMDAASTVLDEYSSDYESEDDGDDRCNDDYGVLMQERKPAERVLRRLPDAKATRGIRDYQEALDHFLNLG